MTPTIKFGTLLGLLLFVFGLFLRYFGIGSPAIIQIFFIVIPAMMIFAAIKAFLQKDPPRPIYNYGKGLLLGLGVVLIGAIISAVLNTAWNFIDPMQEITLSNFITHLWHALPAGFIAALLMPILFFGKNERSFSLKDELLDTDL